MHPGGRDGVRDRPVVRLGGHVDPDLVVVEQHRDRTSRRAGQRPVVAAASAPEPLPESSFSSDERSGVRPCCGIVYHSTTSSEYSRLPSRQVSVEVPDLVGYTPGDAQDALAGLGLEADVQEDAGGPLDFLLGEDSRVCETNPQAGSQVDPGSSVQVVVAKSC